MPRQDILAGLKHAVSRGESLRQAMMTFYRAGYPKQEIEEAARTIQAEQQPQPQTTQPQARGRPVQKVSGYTKQKPEMIRQKIQKTRQQISEYSVQKKPKSGLLILIIGLILIFSIAALLFIFKDQLIEFINKFF